MLNKSNKINKLLHTEHSNNGIITKIWGPPTWIALHTITFGYPMDPTKEQKENYRNFLYNLGNTLPCRYCRESYLKFIKPEGNIGLKDEDKSILDDNALKNRATLTKWGYNIHNQVNRKLGVDYGVTYEDVVRKYESYRAKCSKKKDAKGCTIPLNKKKDCYREARKRDCPLISHEMGKIFCKIARERGIKEKNFYFWNWINRNGGKIEKGKMWDLRNKYCEKIIRFMRENGKPSIEKRGKWKGYPTKLELKLLICRSTNLSKDELEKIINNIH